MDKLGFIIKIVMESLQHVLKMYAWSLSENQASVKFRCTLIELFLKQSLFRKHDFAICVYKLYLGCRVCHGYVNTCGVRAAGMAGTGTVWEILTRGYTVPVTVVSRCHTGTIFACCHGFWQQSLCHTVMQPNMGASRVCILASYHPLLTLFSLPIPHQQIK